MRQAVDPAMPPLLPMEQLNFALLPKDFEALDGSTIRCLEDVVAGRTSLEAADASASDEEGLLRPERRPELTLLLTHTNDVGRKSLDLFRRPFLEAHGASGRVQIFELSMQAGWLRNAMSGVVAGFLRNVVPEEDHARAALLTGETFRYEQALGMADRILGYAYLVDREGIVWWSARCSKDFDEAMGGRVTKDMLAWSASVLQAADK
jgi:hypothetical protein